MFSKCWLSHKDYGLVHDRAGNLAQDHKSSTNRTEDFESNWKPCGRICLCLPSSNMVYVALLRPSLTFLPQRKNWGKSSRLFLWILLSISEAEKKMEVGVKGWFLLFSLSFIQKVPISSLLHGMLDNYTLKIQYGISGVNVTQAKPYPWSFVE